MRTVFLIASAALWVACGSTAQTGSGGGGGGGMVASCTPANCGGCCNGTRCEQGTDALACGTNGALCIACGSGQTCGASGSCETPDAGPTFKRIFATRTFYDGNLKAAGAGTDGLDGADKLCNQAAASVNLGGTWKAWLSTTTVSAISRIADVGPWKNLAGYVVFNNKTNLLTGPIHGIDYDERGGAIFTVDAMTQQVYGTPVWTGSVKAGTVASWQNFSGLTEPATCVDWTSDPPNGGPEYHVGGTGDGADTSASWSETNPGSSEPNAPCFGSARLVCFEQ